MAMTYGMSMWLRFRSAVSQQQLFNVLKEAEAYPGPSLVIAYAPCINHGIKGGMTRTQTVGKEAVACGYWHLWHYNPQLEEQGKNPFVLDSKEPDWTKFRDFLMKEVVTRRCRSPSRPKPRSSSRLPRRMPSGVTTVMSALRDGVLII